MAGAFVSTGRSGHQSLRSGAGSRDTGLRLLASFPDLERVGANREGPIAPAATADGDRAKPRIGWGSIAILAVIAVAACSAAWWIDRGPIDPGAVEIERVRLAERETGSTAAPLRTTMKPNKPTKR